MYIVMEHGTYIIIIIGQNISEYILVHRLLVPLRITYKKFKRIIKAI